jgi:DNA invertase Pin-like site-specific DNA recombinase
MPDRPELQKALAVCRKHKGKLVIAKLDRLSRNLALTLGETEPKASEKFCNNVR